MTSEQAQGVLRERFERYRRLCDESGEQYALDTMLDRETEREKRQMGPLIANDGLANALEKAVPVFEQLGMEMAVVNISNGGRDAVLEIHKNCPYAKYAEEFNCARPCTAACELDIKAVMRAFPGVDGKMLSSLADGDCTCVFKYERPELNN